jgi:uncharacterized protein (DUF1697 family)
LKLQSQVVLLRGVNVGGNNKVPMADFKVLLENLGGQDVRTYIQSGNAVLRCDAARAKGLAAAVEAALKKRLGLSVPVITRGGAELAAALKAHPYIKAGDDPKTLHVGFLAAAPSPAVIKALAPPLGPGEAVTVLGAHAYLRYAQGVGKSKLTNVWFDRQLGTIMTMRNWATCQALLDLAQA